MTMEEILKIFQDSDALLEGHFLLTSGKHSNRYIQCAQVLKNPKSTETLVSELAKKLTGKYDLVVGPAMGGVIVAYEMGRQLGVSALFTERENGKMTLRRGFEIPPQSRVLVVEDVITTGGSVKEVVELVEDAGGIVSDVAVLVDRSSGNHALQAPPISLVKLQVETYAPEACPLCKDSRPVKPGSRQI